MLSNEEIASFTFIKRGSLYEITNKNIGVYLCLDIYFRDYDFKCLMFRLHFNDTFEYDLKLVEDSIGIDLIRQISTI